MKRATLLLYCWLTNQWEWFVALFKFGCNDSSCFGICCEVTFCFGQSVSCLNRLQVYDPWHSKGLKWGPTKWLRGSVHLYSCQCDASCRVVPDASAKLHLSTALFVRATVQESGVSVLLDELCWPYALPPHPSPQRPITLPYIDRPWISHTVTRQLLKHGMASDLFGTFSLFFQRQKPLLAEARHWVSQGNDKLLMYRCQLATNTCQEISFRKYRFTAVLYKELICLASCSVHFRL